MPNSLKIALFTAVLLGTVYFSYLYSVQRLESTQQRVQSAQLADLDRQLNQFSFIPKLLAEDLEIKLALLEGGDKRIEAANNRLNRTQEDSGLDVAFLLDQSGLTIASSNWAEPLSFVGISYSFRPYFVNASLGQGATFFAVGATTGIPGYFIAEPVFSESVVLGVVVAKVSLDVLVNAWSSYLYESMVVDEIGGIILSTREDLLYTPTLDLKPSQVNQLLQERRYELGDSALSISGNQSPKEAILRKAPGYGYFLFSVALASEPWQLITLVSKRRIYMEALMLSLAIVSVCLIVFLLSRLYQQQRRLVLSEQRNSQELEEKVQQRTQQLEQAQNRLISESNFAMLGRMSGAINHEINQPLASLRLNLASLRTMIENKQDNEPEFEQIVIDSDRTTKRIGRVISSLRSLARKSEAQFTPLNMVKIFNEINATVRRERPSISQCLVVTQPKPRGIVLGDEVLIQQAILNLLYNAFDAVMNTAQPSVILQIDYPVKTPINVHDKPVVSVSVVDNGHGVSETVKKTLFEPFSTSRHRDDGLGLGLTIARQIAVDHGGNLIYQEEGTGSRFSIILPIKLTSD